MFSNRKGITPVIAIVLLLLITVGAVGVVYTQFQSLTGDPTQDLQEQDRLRSADYTITAIRSPNTGDPDTAAMWITIKNTGDALWNLSQAMEVKIGPNGNAPSVVSSYSGLSEYDISISNYNCTVAEPAGPVPNDGILEQSDSYTCNTGIRFPRTSWDTTTIELELSGVTQATETCKVRSSNTFTC